MQQVKNLIPACTKEPARLLPELELLELLDPAKVSIVEAAT